MCFHAIPKQAGSQAAGKRRFPVTHYDHREKQENGIITVMTVVECHRHTPKENVPAHCALDNITRIKVLHASNVVHFNAKRSSCLFAMFLIMFYKYCVCFKSILKTFPIVLMHIITYACD